jgi:hypothetical protein
VARKLAFYFHTARHLKPAQIYGRALFRLARPRPDLSPPPPLAVRGSRWETPARRAASLVGDGHFHFLGQNGLLTETGWDDPGRDKLWRYNQHYFDDLNAEDADKRRDWHSALIDAWIAGNPAGHGTGWEPYPTSLRIVNWVKWALAGNELAPEAVASLAVQARWLTRRLERHLLGNHLFANAKALVFAGLFFAGKEPERWRRQGFRILAREFGEQILTDGGQFERSPMYHAIAVEDVLDLINVCTSFASALTEREAAQVAQCRAAVPAMLRWLDAMCHPDGEIAFFNDAAMGIAPTSAELSGYARRLGLKAEPPEPLVWLRDSGYVRLGNGPAVLIADAAPLGPDYLPGHGHADTLSFELSLHGRRTIVNSGTSVYGDGAERLRQRGTAAHSTLVLDGRDSSEVWGGFRVARRARPFDVDAGKSATELRLSAAHDGYAHLPGRPAHRRTWRLSAGALHVTDEVDGAGVHDAQINFHFAPGLVPVRQDDGTWIVRDESTGKPHLTVRFAPPVEAQAVPSSWHPRFGQAHDSHCLRVQVRGDAPIRIGTVFHWDAGDRRDTNAPDDAVTY